MTGRTLTLSALVALAQAKAIITNNCSHDVYVWSVPQAEASQTAGFPIKSGAGYEEAWRYGTATNPGIAIKISPQADGIYKSGEELDFAYSVAGPNKSRVWVNLSPVRGQPFDDIRFHTCQGTFTTPEISTRQCHVTEDIELVLCPQKSAPSARVVASSKATECKDQLPESPKPKPDISNAVPRPSLSKYTSEGASTSTKLTPAVHHPSTQATYAAPSYSSEEHYRPHKHTKSPSSFSKETSGYSNPSSTSKESYASPISKGYPSPPKVTASHSPAEHYASQGPLSKTHSDSHKSINKDHGTSQTTVSKSSCSSTKYTVGSYTPAKHTEEYQGTQKSTKSQSSTSTSSKGYIIPSSVSEGYNAPSSSLKEYNVPSSSSKGYTAPSSSSKGYTTPSSSSKSYTAPSSSSKGYIVPSKATLTMSTSVKTVYASPSTTPHKHITEEVDHSGEDEELPYASPMSIKTPPHHPHSPPSKPTYTQSSAAVYTKPTEHKTTSANLYEQPPSATDGASDKHSPPTERSLFSRFRRGTTPLSAVMQKEAAKAAKKTTPKACFNSFHEPTLPGMTANNAKALLTAYLTVKGRRFADLLNTNATQCPAQAPRMHDGRYGVCVESLCGVLGGECSDVEDDLEEATRAAFGKDFDYTTDDDICG